MANPLKKKIWYTKTDPPIPYLPNKELVEAVEVALFLRRPLLLQGEPGCGKTTLARAVADELGYDYIHWAIKSTTRAQDGLYTYDNVRRLRDAQLAAARYTAARFRVNGNDVKTDEEAVIEALDVETNCGDETDGAGYVRFGELGRAFRSPQRAVVLLDEIDKADIDFPNDLLRELERDTESFHIDEIGVDVPVVNPPVVFITSNNEKDLPDAFLRRCLVHMIDFPKPDQLSKIVKAHLPDISKELLNKAVETFHGIRQDMESEKGETARKAGTSELIDWCRVLSQFGDQNENLKKLEGKIPYPSVLLKDWDDHQQFLCRLEDE